MPTRYVHTNLIARDWRRLAVFYQDVFGCVAVPPERDLFGEWLDRAPRLSGARITAIHLRLPGHGDDGPTLEIFQYDDMPKGHPSAPNLPGFAYVAFAGDDVEATARAVFERGGSAIGKLVRRELPGVGVLTFQYVADPEGNLIELQHRDEAPRKERLEACLRRILRTHRPAPSGVWADGRGVPIGQGHCGLTLRRRSTH